MAKVKDEGLAWANHSAEIEMDKLNVPTKDRNAVGEVVRRNKFMNAFWRVFTQLSRVYADLYERTEVDQWPASTQSLRKCVLSCTEKDITFTREQMETTDSDKNRFVEAVATMRRCGLVLMKHRVSEEFVGVVLDAKKTFQNNSRWKGVNEPYSEWSREFEKDALGRSDFWLPFVAPFVDSKKKLYADELLLRLQRAYFMPLKQDMTLANMRIFTIEPSAKGVAMHVDTSVMKSQADLAQTLN